MKVERMLYGQISGEIQMTIEQQIREVVSAHPDWGRNRIVRETGFNPSTVGNWLAKIRDGKEKQKQAQPSESFEENGDTATAATVHPRIKTLDQLLAHMAVDLGAWEVERHIVNKWEVGVNDGEGGVNVSPLFQVKAWLRKKTVETRTIEQLLEKIKTASLAVPRIEKPKANKEKRSLEICMMDVHLGLLCQQPEADSEWDLERAASAVMAGIEDLLSLVKEFGPFEEVFLPFGNDFTHSDTLFHTTTAGTGQPESIAWHRVYVAAEELAIAIVERLRKVCKSVKVYEVPGNHSRMSDFTLARILRAYFRNCKDVFIDASASPYKFHHCGVNLIGYEHGHSVKAGTLPGLMANEKPQAWSQTHYREWHLGDQHRKGGVVFESQGVSVEYVPGITAGNEWHRLKGFNHQQRGAMAYVWDWKKGPVLRFQHNISQYTHQPLK